MIKFISAVAAIMIFTIGFAGEDKKEKKPKKPKLEKGMYAEFKTSKGLIICKLEFEKAPMTVANFVGLAEGDFTVYDTINYSEKFYDGVKFHRVISNFMIQGGDPLGNGSGGPNHKFFDETRDDLTHSGPGILSMANSDPRNSKRPYDNTGMTNGSQFFITHNETPHLDGLHTVFGHVIFGQDVVNSIVQGDSIIQLKIIRKGKIAKKWNASEHFAAGMVKAKQDAFNMFYGEAKKYIESKDFETAKKLLKLAQTYDSENADVKKQLEGIDALIQKENIANARSLSKEGNYAEAIELFKTAIQKDPSNTTLSDEMKSAQAELKKEEEANLAYQKMVSEMANDDFVTYMHGEVLKDYPNAQLSQSGLVYIVETEGSGKKAAKGDVLSVHYRGTFRRDGKQFDASYDRGQPMSFTFLEQRMIPGFEEGLQKLGKGGKAMLIIPYFQAYGPKGRPGAIPPYADLIFEIEIVDLKEGAPVQQHEHHEGDGHNHDH